MEDFEKSFFPASGGVADGIFECPCGKKHSVSTRVRSGPGVLPELPGLIEAAVGKMLKILLVTDSVAFEYAGRRAADLLTGAGHRVETYVYKARIVPDTANAEAIRGAVAEDTKLLLGVGGGAVSDIAKFAATKYKLPLALVASSPAQAGYLAPFAHLENFGLPESFITKAPDILVYDHDILSDAPNQLLASGFGEALSCALALLDWRTAALMRGEEYCAATARLVKGLIDDSAELADGLVNKERNALSRFFENQLRLSALVQAGNNSRLLNSSPHQCGNILTMLKARQNVACRLHGENAFLFAKLLSKVYLAFLESPDTHALPAPDNVRRLEKISAVFGADEIVAADKLSPLLDSTGYQLACHKLAEYLDDFYALAQSADRIAEAGSKTFSRLYADAGFWIGRYMSGDDIKTILALTPDMSAKYTFLGLLKDIGYLEQFL